MKLTGGQGDSLMSASRSPSSSTAITNGEPATRSFLAIAAAPVDITGEDTKTVAVEVELIPIETL